jgi:hypothetical protein
MKNALILLALVAGVAQAAPQPLVAKYNSTGYVHPDYARHEACELFTDRVVITRSYGGRDGVATVETHPITLSGDFGAILRQASNESLEESPNGLCDGPSTYIEARIPGAAQAFVIFQTGGCGSPTVERSGGSSWILRDLIDQYCPVTHEGSGH